MSRGTEIYSVVEFLGSAVKVPFWILQLKQGENEKSYKQLVK